MTRQSYFVKLLVGNLILMGVIVLVGTVISNRFLTASFRQDQREQQIRIADLSHAFVRQLWPELQSDPGAADRYCKASLPPGAAARLTIIAADGTVLGDSSPVPAPEMANHLTPTRPEVEGAAIGRRDSWDVRVSETLGAEFRYYAKPVLVDGSLVAVVRVAMPTKVLSQSSDFIWRSLLIGAGVAVAAAVLVGLWTSWTRYTPLRRIMREAKAIAAGQSTHTRPSGGGTELTQLSGALEDIRGSMDRQTAMKAEFVANTSHELRTPLATLRAAVEELAEAKDDDTVAKLTGVLERHLGRLEDLTADLLALHSVEDRQRGVMRQDVQLGGLADWVRSHYADRADKKQLRLQVDALPAGAIVPGDRMLLEMILQNLLDNAVKFTPPDGRVSCLLASSGDALKLEVMDTGCGIPAEDRERVFERFFQVDRAKSGGAGVRGTGLGLAIVKHAAERLGAAVILESTPGEGTTVTVVVPLQFDGQTGSE